MTKIKLCGLSRPCDIEVANRIKPDFVGFVFAEKSKRYVTSQTAAKLKQLLSSGILAVGVFVNETTEKIADLANNGIIDIVQLHGNEDECYIRQLKRLTDKPIIKAFRMETKNDIAFMEQCSADYILLDSGAGSGATFDWDLIQDIHRPYFLAGGLDIENAENAVRRLSPYAVDVSSGIETDGLKDKTKMAAFAAAVRKEEKI